MQTFLDLSGWRKVEEGEHISGEHVTVVEELDGTVHSFYSLDSKASFTYHADHWLAHEDVRGHDVYVPVLSDKRPGAIHHFIQKIADTSAQGGYITREGYAIALNDGQWQVVYLSGGRPGPTLSASALLRELGETTDWQLVSGGYDYGLKA